MNRYAHSPLWLAGALSLFSLTACHDPSFINPVVLPTGMPSVSATPEVDQLPAPLPTATPLPMPMPQPQPMPSDDPNLWPPTPLPSIGPSITPPAPLPSIGPSITPPAPLPTQASPFTRYEPANPVSWCPMDNYKANTIYRQGSYVMVAGQLYEAQRWVDAETQHQPGTDSADDREFLPNPWSLVKTLAADWCAGLAIDSEGQVLDLGGWPYASVRGDSVDSSTNDHRLAAHYPDEAIYLNRHFQVKHIPFAALDDLYYGYAQVLNGRLALYDDWLAVEKMFPEDSFLQSLRGNYGQLARAKVVHADQRIHLRIGKPGLSAYLHELLPYADDRQQFAEGVRDFFSQYVTSFDGLHLDWQYAEDHWQRLCGQNAECEQQERQADAANILLLLQQLRSEMQTWEQTFNRPFYLTLTVGEQQATRLQAADIDWVQLMPLVDQVHLWALDYASGTDSQPAHNSSLYPSQPGEQSAAGLIDSVLAAGADPSKLMLSVASHGLGWQGVIADPLDPFAGTSGAPFTNDARCPAEVLCGMVVDSNIGSGEVNYSYQANGKIDEGWLERQIVPQINDDWRYVLDAELGRSYLWSAERQQLISFESPRVIKRKGDLLRDRGLGGLFLTDISANSMGLVNVSNAALQRPSN